MKLYYFTAEEGNFGDDLNPWLWPKLLPAGFLDDDASQILVGIGTLLNHRIPKAERTVVFGSGHGYGSKPAIDASWDFVCVRGPKTAEALGLPAECAVTDPAILIHEFSRQYVKPVSGRIGFVPHYDSAGFGDWDVLSEQAGLHYIDPRWSVERVISELGQCQHVVTEAMHGAIFSDAMRVPWVPAVAYPHISRFKWEDWCLSMQLEYQPHAVPTIWRGDAGLPILDRAKNFTKRSLFSLGLGSAQWTKPLPARSPQALRDEAVARLRSLAASAAPILSADAVHAQRIAQLHERLALMCQRYASGSASCQPA